MGGLRLKTERVSRANKIKHMRTELTKDAVKKRMEGLRDSAKKITHPDDYRIYHYFIEYADSWNFLYPKYCTDRELLKLYKHLYVKLPRLLNRASDIYIRSKSYAGHNSRSYFRKRFTRLHQYLRNTGNASIRLAHMNKHIQVPVNKIEEQPIIEQKKPELINKDQFPATTFADVDKDLKQRVDAVEALWNIASKQKSVADDEFFLEQVIVSYIPESYKLYLNFTHATIDMRRQAKKIFEDQLSMIESKIQQIIDDNAAHSMTALTSQSQFLKGKLTDSTSSLALKKVKQSA